MRSHFKINKILPAANLIVLAILMYLLFCFLFEDFGNERTANSTLKTSQTDVNLAQNSSDSLNSELILNNNIFKSSNVSQKISQTRTPVSQTVIPAVKKQLDLKLLGTVAGDEEVACAVIENSKTKVQDLYKTGDFIQGARIEKIERNRIILLNEGVHEVLNLYVANNDKGASPVLAKETATALQDNHPGTDIIKITSPTEREVKKSAFLAKIGGIEAVLKTVVVTPHTVNGKPDGLQIKGLEGLSMAKFVGLENGDVIRQINRQVVTDNRKAFQVLQKARALSSLDLELTRGSEKKNLSFKID
jgi:type II secretion system protein C